MKISLNWLKDYIDFDLSTEQLEVYLTDLGLEVDGIEQTGTIIPNGVMVGEVIECAKHPDADKLSLTKVDLGNGNIQQIVCGAPNVAKGQKVMVATVGTQLKDKEGNPFIIKNAKIRGQESFGMICAADELGIGDDHSGIMVLPNDTKIGMPGSDYFQNISDTVIEIGLTPNRADATNHIGVARDLAAKLAVETGKVKSVKTPDISKFGITNTNKKISVAVEDSTACPRYTGIVIDNVKVAASPEWMQQRLQAIGVRSINNIVDITNYILNEYGQPLHAFDYNKISGNQVIVKQLAEGTIFTSLDDVARKLQGNDLIICDGDSKPMCMAGVFGGKNSGVSESTKTIFLESAHFASKSIRVTSTKHGLRTDAAKIFEKGSDPNIVVIALKRAALMIVELAGGTISSDLIDIYPNPFAPIHIEITYDFINKRIGIELSPAKVKEILQALEMKILEENENGLKIAIPTNKPDVLRDIDVVEEILRVYGYNNINPDDSIKIVKTNTKENNPYTLKNKVTDLLQASGFNEMMTMSQSQSAYYSPEMSENLVFVNNTSSSQIDIMRPNMLISAMEVVAYNQNRQNANLTLFEFGKSYAQKGDKYFENKQLGIIITGEKWEENWIAKTGTKSSFFTLKGIVEKVLKSINIKECKIGEAEHELFDYCLEMKKNNIRVVTLGKAKNTWTKKFDIKNDLFYAVFDWDSVSKLVAQQEVKFEEISKFPQVRRDLALILEKNIKFDQIVQIAQKTIGTQLQKINLFDVFDDEQKLGEGKKSYAVSFVFESKEKTLTDKEIDGFMSQLVKQFESRLEATIRK
jgi:phenylalanyl-tRNA synthetase beta chain